MNRLVIVGGGISGLAAAWRARQLAAARGGGLEVLVLEAEAEVGGKARSLAADGWLVEAGPQAYLDSEPIMAELVAAAGLEQDLLEANPAAARRYVVRRGKPREVASNPLRFATSGLLGPWGLLRLLLEPLVPRRRRRRGAHRAADDESVWQFARRRLGRQAADRLVSPMVLGIFAGNARSLSLRSVFPQLYAFESEQGSLLRGAMAARRRARRAGPRPSRRLTSFRQGLQQLPRALVERTGIEVRLGVRVEGLERSHTDGFRLRAAGKTLDADAVVLAVEPWSIAALLRELLPEIAHELDAIDGPPVAVVGLGYREPAVARIPRGFGALVPRGEGLAMLGCLWESYVFPQRSPAGTLLVRSMFGGAVDPESGRLTEEELVDLARRELRRLFGVEEEPLHQRVIRWPQAIPQYELGHPQRVERIAGRLDEVPGLYLAGNGLGGVAFARAAAVGAEAGQRACGFLFGDG